MRAMRPILLLILALSACSREPEEVVLPKDPGLAPKKPAIPIRLPAAPLERIAFVREDGVWTVASDGSDLQRIA